MSAIGSNSVLTSRRTTVNLFLSLSVEIRILILFVVGVFVGTQVNRGIYRLAWIPWNIGPWSPRPEGAPPRRWYDALPILGWYFLRRESHVHYPGFWIRPLLMEVGMGLAFAAVYWFEVIQLGVASWNPGPATLHIQCFTHLLLFSLMAVATFIDFDEQMIPDAITLPGTLLGLLIAAIFPMSRALVEVPAPAGYRLEPLHLGSGAALPAYSGWPSWLNGPLGFAAGSACFVAWCIAIMPWTWTTRRGLIKAIQYFAASLARQPATKPLAVLACVGPIGIAAVWYWGGDHWESLLSSLVGMAVGGGTIWAVRIVGTRALGQEAMGFGDVTLMAMVGAFTGWQATLIIFFMAPFSAIFIAIAQFLLTRRHDIAFGPYLCLSTVIWMLASDELWRQYGLPIFSLGWFAPAVGLSALALMGGLLGVWRMVRDAFAPPEEQIPAGQHRTESAGSATEEIALGLNCQAGLARGHHPMRRTVSLQRSAAPIPPIAPLSHRPLPPHARSPVRL